ELLNILPPLARFEVKLIALTGQPRSTLGQAADVCLDVSVEQEACPLNLAPTSSTTAMLALGDALAMVLDTVGTGLVEPRLEASTSKTLRVFIRGVPSAVPCFTASTRSCAKVRRSPFAARTTRSSMS
ncbi:MAG: SIS domain-containing protein, partial [Chthoniobacterales bacterium]